MSKAEYSIGQVLVLFKNAFRVALKTLLEEKGLYQNVPIDYSYTQLASSIPSADCIRLLQKSEVQIVEDRRETFDFERELSSNSKAHYLEDPSSLIGLSLVPPMPLLHCNSCDHTRPHHIATCGMARAALVPAGREQLFTLHFACTDCHSPVDFMIKRSGFKLQLVGRSVPMRRRIENLWPRSIRDIIEDAITAVAENDVAAGYYHLRTAMEHYMKASCGKQVGDKIEGDTLCAEYNNAMDKVLIAQSTSMQVLYSKLSAGLHSRNTSSDEFGDLFAHLRSHFEMKDMLERKQSLKKLQ